MFKAAEAQRLAAAAVIAHIMLLVVAVVLRIKSPFLMPAALAVGVGVALAQAPANMSFFVTSSNPGKGGNLGGLAGADAHCQSLAAAVGAGGKTWRAYLSTDTVNAKDRIGNGPWYNAKGQVVAQNANDLHANPGGGMPFKQIALTEKGAVVNGVGDSPNQHDILTGSTAEGRAFTLHLDCEGLRLCVAGHDGMHGILRARRA